MCIHFGRPTIVFLILCGLSACALQPEDLETLNTTARTGVRVELNGSDSQSTWKMTLQASGHFVYTECRGSGNCETLNDEIWNEKRMEVVERYIDAARNAGLTEETLAQCTGQDITMTADNGTITLLEHHDCEQSINEVALVLIETFLFF